MSLPHRISAGDDLDAEIVQDNFDEIEDNLSDISTQLATMGSSTDSKVNNLETKLNNKISSDINTAKTELQTNINTVSSTASTLTGRMNNVTKGIMPNWNAGYGISSGWTATTNGWIKAETYRQVKDCRVYCNGIAVAGNNVTHTGDWSDWHDYQVFPVATGDNITFNSAYGWLTFYPCRGV